MYNNVKKKIKAEAPVDKTDPFGTTRFAAFKTQILQHKISKDLLRRLEKAEAVFKYRCNLAYELHHESERLETGGWSWSSSSKKNSIQERLATFESIQFFLTTMQSILDEAIKETEASYKPKVAVNRYVNY